MSGAPPLAGCAKAMKGVTMRTQVHKTAQLGELVAAVFDRAARYSTDPREV